MKRFLLAAVLSLTAFTAGCHSSDDQPAPPAQTVTQNPPTVDCGQMPCQQQPNVVVVQQPQVVQQQSNTGFWEGLFMGHMLSGGFGGGGNGYSHIHTTVVNNNTIVHNNTPAARSYYPSSPRPSYTASTPAYRPATPSFSRPSNSYRSSFSSRRR